MRLWHSSPDVIDEAVADLVLGYDPLSCSVELLE
jgi:hypothetical protein